MLREVGWRNLEIEGPPIGGFVTSVQPQPQFGMFCRDDVELNVMAGAVEGTTYVRL